MDKMEKLVKAIMREAEKDGEPVTEEEAREMAEMEIKAGNIKNYTLADNTKKPTAKKERKVDTEKKKILDDIQWLLTKRFPAHGFAVKNEAELSFEMNGNQYTIKLIKHRPPKSK